MIVSVERYKAHRIVISKRDSGMLDYQIFQGNAPDGMCRAYGWLNSVTNNVNAVKLEARSLIDSRAL